MTDAALWRRYIWRGQTVEVIQQWIDPFGRPMLRVASPEDENMAAGVPMDAFLAEAVPSTE